MAPQDLSEQRTRRRDLGHLEDHRAAMADNPGADPDQPLARRGQWPALDRIGQRQGTQGGCNPGSRSVLSPDWRHVDGG
jgi:hypothetical protein